MATEDVTVIYRPYITVKGKKVHASRYGKKAFRIEIRNKNDKK